MGLVALVKMTGLPLLVFGDWRAGARMTASAPVLLKDTAPRGAPAIPRLAIQETRGMSGQPLPIGISLEGVGRDAFVTITGLIPGMTLSTGSRIRADAWRVPATEFADTWIGPPTDFSGAIDLIVELHLSDQSIPDRRLRLEWATPPVLASAGTVEPPALVASARQGGPRVVDGYASSPTPAQGPDKPVQEADNQLAPPEAGVNSVSASGGSTVELHSFSVPAVPAQPAPALVAASAHPSISAPPEPPPPAPSAIPRHPKLDREQIAVLVQRGKQLIANGDLAAARVVLRRAADSNDAEAALALGSTYDPVILRELNTYGFAPDLAIARDWYERAKEFGSEEAQGRILILTRRGW